MKKPLFNQMERLAFRYYFEHKNEFKNVPLIILDYHIAKLKQALKRKNEKYFNPIIEFLTK